MSYAIAALVAVALAEGAGLWYLWKRWRAETAATTAAQFEAGALGEALRDLQNDLVETRRALAERNEAEMINDKATVTTAPGLDDAIARFNEL